MGRMGMDGGSSKTFHNSRFYTLCAFKALRWETVNNLLGTVFPRMIMRTRRSCIDVVLAIAKRFLKRDCALVNVSVNVKESS